MNNDYLVQKKPFAALLIFALPIIIGNFFQQAYTMADSVIVGRYVSQSALAAVGASYSLTNIFICVAIGGGMGASVVVSRYFGAKNYKKVKVCISTALIAFLLLSIILAVIGYFFGKDIMLLLKTPSDILEMSAEYLSIYFLGLPFLFMYNVLAAMFNALGKSRIPLYFLIFSSIFNVILDYQLVTDLNMGIAGVAWATLIAQGISAFLSLIVLIMVLKRLECGRTAFFDKNELLSMTKIALPSILQQSTVSIGMMLVQSVVNSFGTESLAGFSAAMRIESLCIVPMAGIGNAISSFTSQNIGADEKERVKKGYISANIMVIICAVIIGAVLEFFNRPLINIFLGVDGTELAIFTGRNYLKFMGFFFCLIGFKMSVDGVLRGAGDMKIFTLANLINLSIRVVLSVIFAPKIGIQMVWYAVPIGWTVNFLISFLRYRTDKWKKLSLPYRA